MTDDEKRQIIVLRRGGLGYGKIAQQTGISVNTVKSFCRRSNLVVSTGGKSVCECCGKQIEQVPGRSRNASARIVAETNGGTGILTW